MTTQNGNVAQLELQLPVLSADDVIEIGIVQAAAPPGGERLVTFTVKRLGIAFAMGLADTVVAANALARAAQQVIEMNQADAETPSSSIIVARH